MAKSKAKSGGSGEDGVVPAVPYLVLARKYRPQTFADLIGQDAMVRTLRNAFQTGRIAQAYMLTGVRGVGKTTTARILARALNYSLPGKDTGPTIDMELLGEQCLAIIESRHPDVIELDAASNTGIDNVREIIENARYRPQIARMKVFIIDEVHMLSKNAFNALLKTLEEPPEHVKFIFATTEIRKVPVTVLSRCQRFDLKRVDVPVLAKHFEGIAAKEGLSIEPDAVRLIARAAEGSVRDGLSMLDQALSTAEGTVTLDMIQGMLGLADRGRIFDLLDKLFSGDAKAAVDLFAALYRDGADPIGILSDLAAAVHAATRLKVAGSASEGLSAEEQRRAKSLADRLSVGLFARAWQMLVTGIEEASRSGDTFLAAEMLLIRMAYTAELPSPDELVKRLGTRPADDAKPAPAPAAPPKAEASAPWNSAPPSAKSASRQLRSFAEVIDFVGEKRDAKLKIALEDHVSLVRFEPGQIEVHLLEGAEKSLANDLGQRLTQWTGERWIVVVSRDKGERPVGDVRREKAVLDIDAIKQRPEIQALLKAFPNAEITAVRPLRPVEDDESATG